MANKVPKRSTTSTFKKDLSGSDIVHIPLKLGSPVFSTTVDDLTVETAVELQGH